MLKRLLGSRSSDRRLLIRGSAWTVAFRIAGAALSLGVNLVLARILVAESYGAYNVLMSAIALASIPAVLGLPSFVTREVAASVMLRNWATIKGLLQCSFGLITISSSLIIVLAVTTLHLIDWQPPGGRSVLVTATIILIVNNWKDLVSAALRGFHQIYASQLPEFGRMSFFVAVLLVLWMTRATSLNLPKVFEIQAFATIFAVLIGLLYLRRTSTLHDFAWTQVQPRYEGPRWLLAALPLMFIDGMSTINSNADILMLGGLVGNDVAGIYHAATRGAAFLSLFLTAAIIPLGPTVARLYAAGEQNRLQNILAQSTIAVFVVSLPFGLFLIFWGHHFLQLFGDFFIVGDFALSILSIGQLFNIAAGPVQMILIMTGHGKSAAYAMVIGTASNVILNAVLIPVYGIAGAAAATSISIVIWNAMMVAKVRKETKLFPSMFAIFRPPTGRSGRYDP